MMPSEFWNSTYRELIVFVKANQEARKNRNKDLIVLAEGFGNKIIKAMSWKNPKNKSLIYDIFKALFEEETKAKVQTPEEQIRILRSMK